MGQTKSQRTMLSEDGELRPIDTETDGESASPDARLSAVFCCNCGTANQGSSRFCRACGQSLDEQIVNAANLDEYAPPESKNKRSADHVASSAQSGHLTPQEITVMIEVMTLLVMGVLGAVSIATQQTWLALVILLIWLVVQVIRRRPSGDH